MAPQRKRGFFILAGLTLVVLLFHLRGRGLYATKPLGLNNVHGSSSILGAASLDNTRVNEAPSGRVGASTSAGKDGDEKPWDQFKERFPVDEFLRLPADSPSKLPLVQHSFTPETEDEQKVRLQRRAAVKKAFDRCWSSYRKSAWKHDEVMPITGQANDWFGGWAATLLDTLDTLWIMDMKDEFEEAVGAAVEVDFSVGSATQSIINTFETNIRHLGGLLSAYDLSGDHRLLEKAVELGDMLYVSFDTPNRMPITRWNPVNAAQGKQRFADDAVLAAEIGSFGLEFTRLSQLTGNPKWYDAAQRITDKLHHAQGKTRLPGMFNIVFNGRDATFDQGGTFKLGAMIDSLYEYFPKTYALLGGRSGLHRDLYDTAARTAIKHTLFKPYTPDNADILIAGEIFVDQTGKFFPRLNGEHLGCYVGGMFALGGMLTNNELHVETGRKLTDGCIWAYKNSPLGIMPESFSMTPCPKSSSCPWSYERWKQDVKIANELTVNGEALEKEIAKKRIPQGFTSVSDKRYILRPEAIESVFILYRITGDKKLQDAAWDMFTAIDKHTKTSKGNAALDDILVSRDPPKQDRMESFWLAETLKYFYLIFSEPDLISLDEYVFNTEAHPFKRPT